MSKKDKMLQAFRELLEEYKNIQSAVESLPRGYISKKVISGHVYHYRQWREGSHVLSDYVPEVLLNGNHKEIEKWKREKQIEETKKYRPDLLERKDQ